MTLRKTIEFWLSKSEKKTHLSLLWDVFENMNWIENVDEITMIERDLNFRQVEAQFRDDTLMHCSKLISFVVMIRAFVNYEELILWIKQILSSMMRSIEMSVVEESKRENKWNSKFIVIIEEFVIDVKLSTSITILTQETSQDQLEIAIIDRSVAMFIFKSMLKNVKRIAIVKIEWNKIQYETTIVVTYKIVDTLRFIINDFSFMINVSFILRSFSKDSRCDWFDKSHIFMRVINRYDRFSSNDKKWVALKIQNERTKW